MSDTFHFRTDKSTTREKHRIAYLLVLKRGEKPANDAWYIQQVAKNMIPELFDSPGVTIGAHWRVGSVDQTQAIFHALREFGNDVADATKYEIRTEEFSDADGDGGMVLIAYHKLNEMIDDGTGTIPDDIENSPSSIRRGARPSEITDKGVHMNGRGLIRIKSHEELESEIRAILPGKPELLVRTVIDRLEAIRKERGLPAVGYPEFRDSILSSYEEAIDAKARSDGRDEDRLFDSWGSMKVTRSWSGDDKKKAIDRTEEAARRETEECGKPEWANTGAGNQRPSEKNEGGQLSSSKHHDQEITSSGSKNQPNQKLIGWIICPKCRVKVLPKSNGTCPSCQARILR
jgi:hypothetical protein